MRSDEVKNCTLSRVPGVGGGGAAQRGGHRQYSGVGDILVPLS